jgi:anti-anti-sigma factor
VSAPEFRCAIEPSDEQTVVHLAGELDLTGSETLLAAVADLDGRVVVDLTDVSFLDSAGMSAFAITHKRLVEAGGSFTLRAPRPHVRRVLEIAGMDIWFESEA